MKDITVQELKTKLDNKEDFILIDVREPDEYAQYNIGAKLIPLGSIEQAIQNGGFDDVGDKEIILHCRSGKRSKTAQHILKTAGITNTKNLTGGVIAWAENFG